MKCAQQESMDPQTLFWESTCKLDYGYVCFCAGMKFIRDMHMAKLPAVCVVAFGMTQGHLNLIIPCWSIFFWTRVAPHPSDLVPAQHCRVQVNTAMDGIRALLVLLMGLVSSHNVGIISLGKWTNCSSIMKKRCLSCSLG